MFAACFAWITDTVLEEGVEIACRKNGNRSYHTRAEQAKSSETSCMNAMDQRRKLQKMCLTYRLCATPLHAPPTQHLLAKHFTAFAPLCLPKKIHNVFLHTNVFHSNLDKKIKILQPSSQTCNYFIDPTTHFWGDPISITLFLSTNY